LIQTSALFMYTCPWANMTVLYYYIKHYQRYAIPNIYPTCNSFFISHHIYIIFNFKNTIASKRTLHVWKDMYIIYILKNSKYIGYLIKSWFLLTSGVKRRETTSNQDAGSREELYSFYIWTRGNWRILSISRQTQEHHR